MRGKTKTFYLARRGVLRLHERENNYSEPGVIIIIINKLVTFIPAIYATSPRL